MLTPLLIIAPVVLLWLGWRWLLAPEKAPAGWDEVPVDWDEEAARKAMCGNEEARG